MNKQLNHRQIKTIQNFWNWFQDNEQAIYNACKLEINKDEVLFNLERNFNYVSKRIEHFITNHPQNENKLKVFITAHGYRKLFPKMRALEENIPILEFFSIQVYIIPFNTQEPTIPYNMVETIKNTFIKLEDYNTVTKKIILTLYCHGKIMQLNIKKVERHAYLLLLFSLGEVKYKKHIYDFNCEVMPQNTNGLLSLSELPEFIDYLAKIISEENLKPEETITFINNSFKNGEIQAAGTAFASILPPVSRFSPTRERTIKKETVLEKLKKYFDRFFDISSGEIN